MNLIPILSKLKVSLTLGVFLSVCATVNSVFGDVALITVLLNKLLDKNLKTMGAASKKVFNLKWRFHIGDFQPI